MVVVPRPIHFAPVISQKNSKKTWICYEHARKKKSKKSSQMVVKDGDESHGTIRKKSPKKTNPRNLIHSP